MLDHAPCSREIGTVKYLVVIFMCALATSNAWAQKASRDEPRELKSGKDYTEWSITVRSGEKKRDIDVTITCANTINYLRSQTTFSSSRRLVRMSPGDTEEVIFYTRKGQRPITAATATFSDGDAERSPPPESTKRDSSETEKLRRELGMTEGAPDKARSIPGESPSETEKKLRRELGMTEGTPDKARSIPSESPSGTWNVRAKTWFGTTTRFILVIRDDHTWTTQASVRNPASGEWAMSKGQISMWTTPKPGMDNVYYIGVFDGFSVKGKWHRKDEGGRSAERDFELSK